MEYQPKHGMPFENRSASDIISSACINCRSKHLKCNGENPCSRCFTQEFICTYAKSRRGYKAPRSATESKALITTNTQIVSTPANDIFPGILDSENMMFSILRSSPVLPSETLSTADTIAKSSNPEIASSDLTINHNKRYADNIEPKCIEAFFSYFHRSHPFILPRAQFLAYTATSPLPLLSAAVRYIGSCYLSSVPTTSILTEFEDLLLQSEIRSQGNGFMVQALLLMAIGLDGHRELKRASELLASASDLAMELGMQHKEFAAWNNQGSKFLEESWRRTFWELYVVNGMIAGMHQCNAFKLYSIFASTRLPCEEKQYELGLIPPPSSIEDFDESSFIAKDIEYSSFTYRVAAARNLGEILALSPHILPNDPAFIRADAKLVNWRLHLPFSKIEFMDEDGRVDEMLFQAQMITNASSIILHRRHSNLNTSVAYVVSSCTPTSESAVTCNTSNTYLYNLHTAKVISATENLTNLILLPSPITQHSPFLTCSCSLASIIHLSHWSFFIPPTPDNDLKQQLKLNIGALKKLGEIWPSAVMALGQVQGVAQELFLEKKRFSEIWNTFTEEEMLANI